MLKGENTRITPRMIEIFDLISRGLAPKEAAVRLGISPKTVDATMMKCRQRLELLLQSAATASRLIADRFNAPTPSGLGTGRCVCGRTISTNKGSCRRCSQVGDQAGQ